MRLLIYEHPCKARHGVIEEQPSERPPQRDYMEVGITAREDPDRCKDCEFLEADNRCGGEYRVALTADQVAALPQKVQRLRNRIEELEFEAEFLRDDLADAEDRASDMQADSEMAKATVETVERLVKDVELYLAQVTNSRAAYADAGKHLRFIRDLALDARKRIADIEAACSA